MLRNDIDTLSSALWGTDFQGLILPVLLSYSKSIMKTTPFSQAPLFKLDLSVGFFLITLSIVCNYVLKFFKNDYLLSSDCILYEVKNYIYCVHHYTPCMHSSVAGQMLN